MNTCTVQTKIRNPVELGLEPLGSIHKRMVDRIEVQDFGQESRRIALIESDIA